MLLANLWHVIVSWLPVIALVLLVWWFIREEPDAANADSEDDGGSRTWPSGRPPHRPRPGPGHPRTRLPRRGPHRDGAPRAPLRVRSLPTGGRPRPQPRRHVAGRWG